MQFATEQFKLRSKTFIASMLVALVLLLDALAVCPSLHGQFHQDSKSAQHQCAVTLFAHGQVDSATVEVSAAVPTILIESTAQYVFSVFAPAIENLPAGRAPPVFVSPLA